MWTNDKKNITSNTISLSIISFLMNCANSIIFSNAGGLWSNNWNADLNILTQRKSMAESVGYFFKFVLGFLSDMKSNRKTFLIIGYGSIIVTQPLFLTSVLKNSSDSQRTFTIANFIDRIANNFRDTPRDALIAYSTKEEHARENFVFRRTFSYIGSFTGGIFSIIYFSFFKSFPPAFIFSSILSFIGLIILIKYVEDPIVIKENNKSIFQDLKNVFSLPYAVLSAAFILLFAGKFGETAIYPVLKLTTNNAIYYRLAFIVFYIGSFLASLFVFEMKKNSLNNIIAFGALFSCANSLILYITNPMFLLLFCFLFGIFNGILESLVVPVLLQFSKSQRKGTVIGISNLIIGLGYFFQSFFVRRFIGSQIYFFSTTCLIVSMIILTCFSLLFQKEEVL